MGQTRDTHRYLVNISFEAVFVAGNLGTGLAMCTCQNRLNIPGTWK